MRAVLADGFSFLVSAVTLALIRHREEAPGRRHGVSFVAEIGEGLRHVFGSRVLRAQLLCMAAAGLFIHAFEAPLYIFAYNQLHTSPGFLGGALASQGLGSLFGTTIASRVSQLLGVGKVIALADALAIALTALIPLALFVPTALVLFPVFIVTGALGTVGNIAQVTLRQSLSPPHLQGRMTAVFRTFFWGAWPIGNLLGGVVAVAIGAGPTLVGAAILGALVNLTIIFTPLWKVRGYGPVAHPQLADLVR